MKKSKFLLLSVLFMIPIMLFAGCEDPKYFSITTSTNDGNIGSVSGGNSTFIEGSEVSLVATSRSTTTDSFICWVKDYTNVVSLESTTKVTVNANTQGNYTALFASNLSSMTYATVSDILYDDIYSNLEYTISCAPMNNTTQTRAFTSGTFTQDANTYSQTTSVFNMYDRNSENGYVGYVFTVTLKITDLAGESVVDRTYNFSVTNSLFDESTGVYTYTNGNLSVKFEKISKNIAFGL